MAAGAGWAARHLRLSWRTFWWVAGINTLPSIMLVPLFGAGFAAGLWFVALLPYSIAGSLSPLLKMSFSHRLLCQGFMAFVFASIALFGLTDVGLSDPATAVFLIGLAGFGLPVIDASYSLRSNFHSFRTRTGGGLEAFFATDPDNWSPGP